MKSPGVPSTQFLFLQRQDYHKPSRGNVQSFLSSDCIIPEVTWIYELPINSVRYEDSIKMSIIKIGQGVPKIYRSAPAPTAHQMLHLGACSTLQSETVIFERICLLNKRSFVIWFSQKNTQVCQGGISKYLNKNLIY